MYLPAGQAVQVDVELVAVIAEYLLAAQSLHADAEGAPVPS